MLEYQCPQCPALFTSPAARTAHLVDTHEGAGPSNPGPSGRRYYCRHCGTSKKTHRGIAQHIRKVEECRELQEEWLKWQIEVAGMSPRRLRRANTPASGSQNAHLSSDIEMAGDSYIDEERAEDADILGARWNEDPMEWELPEDAEQQAASSDYGEDQDSEAGSDQEMVDSDEEFNDEVEDIQSDDEFLPENQNPPHSPSDRSNSSGVTIKLCEETDEHGHTVYVEEYHVPTVGQPVRREAVPEFCRTPAPAAGLLRFLAILALALALARQLPEPVPEFRQVQELARIAGLLLLAIVKGHHIQVCYSSLDAHGKGLSNDMLHTL
ncbi:plasma membrane ATPase 4 [Ceratobasidium sp. AG-Ba]|nr:plasma membrane ATPase 4 [Ceratobasidium sp. AG-Ba]